MTDTDKPQSPTRIRIPTPATTTEYKVALACRVIAEAAAYLRAKTGLTVNVSAHLHPANYTQDGRQELTRAAVAVGFGRNEWLPNEPKGGYYDWDNEQGASVLVTDPDMPHILTPALEAALLADAVEGRR